MSELLFIETPTGKRIVFHTTLDLDDPRSRWQAVPRWCPSIGWQMPEDLSFEESQQFGIFLLEWKKRHPVLPLWKIPKGWKVSLPAEEVKQ